jgi:hypothetical protein
MKPTTLTVRRLAGESLLDPRTAARWLAGGSVNPATAAALDAAAARLGITRAATPTPSAPPRPDGSVDHPPHALTPELRAVLVGAASFVCTARQWYEGDRYLARVGEALICLAEGNAREAAEIVTSLAEEVQP